ncbi:IPT/TIG domain-containing protein [Sphingomonas sp. NFR04]|uniref:autotransporter domain-containing protein n=1 Tax=Sphingomonas sp. NFR04 TaxID=1566283 RepID=UPI0008E7D0D9|nr:autotransporter domain-containing protein [Sphingomonas sp. NFR04]SFK52254.1 IPT/TIG domain-containing protein [Sphingomonas sp. NFR04]
MAAGGLFLFAPAQAFAASAACNEINTFSRTYTVDTAGNSDYSFTTQPLINGETVTFSWTGNTQGAHVFVIYTQNGGSTIAPDSLPDSTASSGSGSFTFTGTSGDDFLQMGAASYAPYGNNTTPVPFGNARNIQITVSCSASTSLAVTMNHSGNAIQGGSLAYTIVPSVSGGATTSATLTAAFTLPSGMTYSSASGSGWSCSGSGQTGSCTRTSGFSAGAGPSITLNANFASNATSPLTPSVQLSGGGASNTASASDATVVLATPTVTSITPTSGSAAGGTSVVITGTNLSGATGVAFGATAASYTVNSATQITATAPAGTGTVDVRVTTASGTSPATAADQFTYVTAPTASSYTAPAVAYGATGATFSLAGQVSNSPTSFAVGSATTANGGTVSINNAGLVTYSAPAGYRGNDSFTYTASNGGGTSAPATVTVPVSNPTLSTSLTGSGTRGTALSGVQIVATGGTAPYNCSTTLASGALPAGTQLNTNCTITGTPTSSGTFSFTANVTDSSVPSGFTQATGSLSLVIASPALTLSPAAGALPAATDGTSYSQSFTAGGGTAPYTYGITAGTLPTGLLLSGSTVAGTPTQTGTFNFTVTATDSASAGSGGPYSVSNSYSITVGGQAAPTVANRSGVAIPYNSGGTPIDLSASISGTHSSIAVATPPAHGTTSVAGDVVTYTPAAGYQGADSFTYTATGPGGTSSAATVSVVVATPTAPTAADRSGVTVPSGGTGTAIDLSSSITGVHTSIAVATPPAHGTTSVAGDVVTYTPATGYSGTDSFTYTATGPGGTSAPGTVSITVAAPAPPTAADRSGVAVDFNSPGTPIDLTTSVTGVYSSIAVAGAPAHGTTTVSGSVITYIPAKDSFGADSFTYTATGPGGTSAPATVSVSVATPPPPAAEPGSSTVPAATAVQPGSNAEINLSALVNGSFTSIEIQTPPAHGTLTLRTIGASPAGGVRPLAVAAVTAIYTPNTNYVGADSFSFVAVGPGGRSAPAEVTIQVVGAVPQALPKTAETGDGQRVSVDLTAGAVNGPFTGAAVVGMTPADAAVTQVVAIGSGPSQAYRLDIVPAARFGGKIVIQYTLSNAVGTSAPATITVTVTARPDPTLDPIVRGVSDAQAEAARRFGRAQVANFMRRTEQLHNGGGSSKPQMGVSLASRDQRPVMRNNPAFDAYAATITERMRISGEDPALGTIARGRPSALNGDGALDTAPENPRRAAMAGSSAATAPTAGRTARARDDANDGDGTRRKGSVALWSGGAIDIGTQDATSDRAKITATTSGLSTGVDLKVAEGVLIGIGGGYSNDVSRIGGSKARVRSESRLAAAYASLMPAQGAFVDGMVGFGDLSFNTRRLEGTTNATALGSRDGNFTLGALALGIDQEGGPLRWSLYARGEFVRANLDGYTESGAGRMDLRFDSREVHSLTGTLGARLETERRYGDVTMTPRLRFEWNHELQDAAAQRLDYADIPGQALYSISTFGWSRNQYQLTLGTRMLLPRSWTVDLEGGYRGGGHETAGTLRVLVGKEF